MDPTNRVDLMGLVQAVQQQQREIYALDVVYLILSVWCAGLTVVTAVLTIVMRGGPGRPS